MLGLLLRELGGQALIAKKKDHILGLRKHIRTGRRGQGRTADEKHLDSAVFWRQAYEESAAAQSRLLDRIYELEQENEILRLAKDQAGPVPQIQPVKRKLGSSDGPTSDVVSGSRKQSKGAKRKDTGVAKQNDDREKFGMSFEVPQDRMSDSIRQTVPSDANFLPSHVVLYEALLFSKAASTQES